MEPYPERERPPVRSRSTFRRCFGVAVNYIPAAKHITAFFKYYDEYKVYAHYQGDTIVFGAAWTFLIPRPPPPRK